jgi:RNA polymerase sigma-70 factor (ECF subfamily)
MSSEPHETQAWLRDLRAGKPAALAELFHYYRPRLRKMVCCRMDPRLAARVDASDVLQEAYLDAARQVQGYLRQPSVAFYVWLRGLAWKRLLKCHRQHLRAQCRAVGRELALDVESSALLAGALLAADSTPSQVLVREELRQRVQRALAQLKAEDREILLMRKFEEMSNGEVAQALGLSDAAATMRYGRALFRLQKILEADGGVREFAP